MLGNPIFLEITRKNMRTRTSIALSAIVQSIPLRLVRINHNISNFYNQKIILISENLDKESKLSISILHFFCLEISFEIFQRIEFYFCFMFIRNESVAGMDECSTGKYNLANKSVPVRREFFLGMYT